MLLGNGHRQQYNKIMETISSRGRSLRPLAAAAAFACLPTAAFAQSADTAVPSVVVEGARSTAEQRQLPLTSESVTAARIADTVNAMTVEDTLKYLPNVLVRRRFIGDTQAPMATRTTGINASARSLVYADGIPLSALIHNNNQNGSPQWFMVSPEEVARIDVLYGPFAAAYPGNSYGAVTEIVTRMPRKFEASARLGLASQDFSLYGASDRYPSTHASFNIGNRSGELAWWFGASHLSSFSQPVTYLTVPVAQGAAAASAPVVTGAVPDRNRTGAPIEVLGAGNLTHTVQDTAKLKLAYDFSPTVSAAWLVGYWRNSATATSASYLKSVDGAPWFGGSGSVNIDGRPYNAGTIAGLFSSNATEQEHWMHALSFKTRNEGAWNWEAVLTHFNYARDVTRTSVTPAPAGRTTDASGTSWSTLDLKGTWDQRDTGRHSVSFGVHHDQYKLASPTYSTAEWERGPNGTLFADSRGKTRTQALWVQDAWQLDPSVVATLGARYEWWRAYDGYNLATAADGRTFPVNQPEVERLGISPKASLAWRLQPDWRLMASFGKAIRFPTVGELYQNVQTGATFTQANPYLKPEKVLSGELAIERTLKDGKVRVSLFEEHLSDALIAQTSSITGVAVPVSFVQNVDKTRQRGIELVADRKDVLVKGLEINGSATYVSAKIIQNDSFVPPPATPGATSAGKRTPYVPRWRATAVATYRPDDKFVYTLAARYSSRLYSTVDNSDVNPSTYQGFDSYFVTDVRVRYLVDRHWSAALGIDNLNNRKYFLFHPFPQRTFTAELKYDF
jgi:iron complex outermembrane receptor protein